MFVQPLYRLVYISKTTETMTSEAIKELLIGSRQRNEVFQISGLLLYMHGNFLQVLEGGQSDVEQLYKNISADPRHSDTEVISAKKIDARVFSEWAMAFSEISNEEFKNLSGFRELNDLRIRDKARRGAQVDDIIQSFKNTYTFG